jgi:transcriptional repressor NrdR
VTDSRDDSRSIRRRRECLSCHERFTTYEKIELPRFLILKRDRSLESYDRLKLTKGLKLSLEKRPFTDEQIDTLIDDIEQELMAMGKKEITSQQIGDIVSNKLQTLDEVAYLRFISVYRSFTNASRFLKEADKIVNKRAESIN